MAAMTDILAEMEQAERPRRPQRLSAEYEFECLCGEQILTTQREVTCPRCAREISIER